MNNYYFPYCIVCLKLHGFNINSVYPSIHPQLWQKCCFKIRLFPSVESEPDYYDGQTIFNHLISISNFTYSKDHLVLVWMLTTTESRFITTKINMVLWQDTQAKICWELKTMYNENMQWQNNPEFLLLYSIQSVVPKIVNIIKLYNTYIYEGFNHLTGTICQLETTLADLWNHTLNHIIGQYILQITIDGSIRQFQHASYQQM